MVAYPIIYNKKKKSLKGVGTASQMLWGIVYNCECEHSHLYPMLHRAHQGCATPFKEKKSSFGGRKRAKPRKTKVTMLDYTKTLKLVGKNGRQPRPQWPGCFCKKMCRSNTCKKSHFVRKIHPAPNMLRSRRIFCTKCNFLLPLRQHIFRQ